MAKPPFKLVFTAKPPDQTLAISNLTAFPTRFSNHVRRDGDAYSIHGNVLVTVLDAAGRDVSAGKDMRLFRRRRYWDLKSDNPLHIAGADMAEGWSEDNMGGGGWRDAPSINASKGGGGHQSTGRVCHLPRRPRGTSSRLLLLHSAQLRLRRLPCADILGAQHLLHRMADHSAHHDALDGRVQMHDLR